MKKFWFLSFVVLAFSCSEPDEPGCSSDLESIQLDINAVYTGETLSLALPSLCTLDQLSVVINDEEVILTPGDNSEISFTVPVISESSATITVRAGKSEKSFGPFSVIKAAGTWTAVAPFTGSGRAFMAGFATTTDGYLFGGNSSTGSTDTYHTDLYKYNVGGNSWTKVTTHSNFEQSSEAFIGNTLYLYGNKYSVTDNTFSALSYAPQKSGDFYYWAQSYFTCNGSLYIIADINQNFIEIQKYNAVANTWSVVKELPFTYNGDQDYFSFPFAVEHNGITYIGILPLNSVDIQVWAFDGTANSFTKVSSVSNGIVGSTQDLKHLFTINDLAYFIEVGEAFQHESGEIDITKARNYFYVYDFAANTWHKVKTEFPQSMYGTSSFNVGNRGFAGLGADEGTPTGLVYSQQFFEFVQD